MLSAILCAMLLQAAQPPNTAATVRGKVVSDTGDAVRYAAVQLIRGDAARAVRTVVADSSGQFELIAVEPGVYTMTCTKPGFLADHYHGRDDAPQLKLSQRQVETVTFHLTRAAVISGTITDSYGEPVAGATVQVMAKRYRRGRPELQSRDNVTADDHGEYRAHNLRPGRYYVQASRLSRPNGGPALASRIFPSATRLEDAQSVAVKSGEEREGVNVMLPDAVLVDLTGRVIDAATGQPLAGANVFLNAVDWTSGVNANARIGPDGSFRMNGIAAGGYRLMVPPARAGMRNTIIYVDLRPGTANDLLIKSGGGVTVSGSVKTEGPASGGLRIMLSARSVDGEILDGIGGNVDKDGNFKIENVNPALYELVLSTDQGTLPGTFFLSAAKLGERDVVDTPLEVGDSGPPPLSLTVDYRPAAISGIVHDENGKTLSKVQVVMVSADPKTRLLSRYFHSATTRSDGSFKLTGIVPGDYLMIPWSGDDPGQVLDPEVFAMLEKHAVPVTLIRGAAKTQDLTVDAELRTLVAAFAQ